MPTETIVLRSDVGLLPRTDPAGRRQGLAALLAGPIGRLSRWAVVRATPRPNLCSVQVAVCYMHCTACGIDGQVDPVRMIPQPGRLSMGQQRECVVSSRSAMCRTWLTSRSGNRLCRGAPCQEHGANATETSCVCHPWCRHPMRPLRAAYARSPQSRWCPGCKPRGRAA